MTIGDTVGSYRITALLGEGGMATVYRGEHVLLGRPAAIKLISPAQSHDRAVVDRFFAEAMVMSTIHHAGVVEIYDFGYHGDGRPYQLHRDPPQSVFARYTAPNSPTKRSASSSRCI